MSLESASLTTPGRDAVYVKTAKGRGEMASRGTGLTARQRTVLIMLDGRKSCAALAPLMPAGQVTDIVAQLLALDLIAPCGAAVASDAGAVPAAAHAGVASATQQVRDDGLDRVKRYMVSTAQAHLGLLASEVVERIERAADADQLRAVVGHWHMALQESKHGRATAGTQLEAVRAGLREVGVAT
jgi:hypothetical protein